MTWTCKYCGQPNFMEDKICRHCGKGLRPGRQIKKAAAIVKKK